MPFRMTYSTYDCSTRCFRDCPIKCFFCPFPTLSFILSVKSAEENSETPNRLRVQTLCATTSRTESNTLRELTACRRELSARPRPEMAETIRGALLSICDGVRNQLGPQSEEKGGERGAVRIDRLVAATVDFETCGCVTASPICFRRMVLRRILATIL